MVSRVKSVLVRQQAATSARRERDARLLWAGAAAFVVAVALYVIYAEIHPYSWTLDPVDLGVYRSGGLIVRHIRPVFDPKLAAPLYDWGGYGSLGLKFTYTPFAAIVFAVVSFIPWKVLIDLSVGANIVFLALALWFTFGALGYRDRRVRLGATLLASGAALWTEPVIRVLYLGQVNLALMALIIWDLTQPDTKTRRWWKGAGVGLAAGIKLVPLVFIPYLLFTRKFRQAFMTCVGFAFSVLLGFVIMPSDSAKWWFHGLFFQGGRTGFTGWEGNQSLRGLLARFAGSIAGSQTDYFIAVVLIGILGVVCAAMLDRAGHQMAGILAAALTGLLLSPISWDHHWVWIAPGAAVAGHYAVRAWRSSRARAWAWWVLAGGMLALYGAWPGSLWGEPTDLGAFSLGILWQPPNTNPGTYYKDGDQPWFVEYHWHGIELLTGNAFILGGLVLFAVLVVAALRVSVFRAPEPAAGPPASVDDRAAGTDDRDSAMGTPESATGTPDGVTGTPDSVSATRDGGPAAD
jgi:alpha-1,2-mannosyltransferase